MGETQPCAVMNLWAIKKATSTNKLTVYKPLFHQDFQVFPLFPLGDASRYRGDPEHFEVSRIPGLAIFTS